MESGVAGWPSVPSDGVPRVREGNAYVHPLYASSLSEFGQPLELPRCGGWLLRRQIQGADAIDATGCYPLFACRDWSRLGEEVERLENLVSLVLVTDPFGDFDLAELRRHFDDVRVFKPHYVIDLAASVEQIASRHHRYYARRALRRLEIEPQSRPADLLDEWTALYGVLVERKGLRGIQAFSRDAFGMQLAVPGALVLVARLGGELVGADWYYVDGPVAYGHLAAFSPEGYRVNASYALQWRAIELLAELGVRWLDIGGAPGVAEQPHDGLRRFKKGWATHTRPTYLATRVLDSRRYEELSRGAGGANGYFPAYRAMALT
jgi:hypothetical protein